MWIKQNLFKVARKYQGMIICTRLSFYKYIYIYTRIKARAFARAFILVGKLRPPSPPYQHLGESLAGLFMFQILTTSKKELHEGNPMEFLGKSIAISQEIERIGPAGNCLGLKHGQDGCRLASKNQSKSSINTYKDMLFIWYLLPKLSKQASQNHPNIGQ